MRLLQSFVMAVLVVAVAAPLLFAMRRRPVTSASRGSVRVSVKESAYGAAHRLAGLLNGAAIAALGLGLLGGLGALFFAAKKEVWLPAFVGLAWAASGATIHVLLSGLASVVLSTADTADTNRRILDELKALTGVVENEDDEVEAQGAAASSE